MQPTPVSATCFQHQPPAPEGSQQLPDGLLFSSCWSVSQSQTTMVSCVVPLHHFSLLAGSKVQPSALLWKCWVSSSLGLPLSCVIPLCLLPSTVDSLVRGGNFFREKGLFQLRFYEDSKKNVTKERTSNNLVYN